MSTRKIFIEIPDFLVSGSVFKTAIESFNWGENRTIGATNGVNREAAATPRRTIVISRLRDKYSVRFHQAALITRRFNKLKITVTQADNGVAHEANSYVFYNVVVATFETAAAGSVLPTVETFTLDFMAVDFSNGSATNQEPTRVRDQYDLRTARRL